jgi:WD40 repeat protein
MNNNLFIQKGSADAATPTITCICVLPNNQVVSGSSDNTISIWNIVNSTLTLLKVLRGHTDTVNSVYALPDGRIVSGSNDRTVRVWNIVTDECIILSEHTDAVTSVCALSGGEIVSGSTDRTVRIWSEGVCIKVLKEFTTPISSVCVCYNDRIACCSSNSMVVYIWELNPAFATKPPPDMYIPYRMFTNTLNNNVYSICALSKNRIAIGTDIGDIEIWKINYPHQPKRLYIPRNRSTITSICELPDNKIISGIRQGVLQMWDIATSSVQMKLDIGSTIKSISLLENGNVVFLAGNQIHTVKPFILEPLISELERFATPVLRLNIDIDSYNNKRQLIKINPCNHVFHQHCITDEIIRQNSLNLGNTCPKCRAPIQTVTQLIIDPTQPAYNERIHLGGSSNNYYNKLQKYIGKL